MQATTIHLLVDEVFTVTNIAKKVSLEEVWLNKVKYVSRRLVGNDIDVGSWDLSWHRCPVVWLVIARTGDRYSAIWLVITRTRDRDYAIWLVVISTIIFFVFLKISVYGVDGHVLKTSLMIWELMMDIILNSNTFKKWDLRIKWCTSLYHMRACTSLLLSVNC